MHMVGPFAMRIDMQDTFKLTKAILKCQLDIFDQIGSILAELQEQARQEAEEDGNESEEV